MLPPAITASQKQERGSCVAAGPGLKGPAGLDMDPIAKLLGTAFCLLFLIVIWLDVSTILVSLSCF